MSQLIIKNIDEFKVHYPVTHTDHGFRRIVPFIEIAQDDYLLPILGEELLQALLDHHNPTSGSGSGSGESEGSASGSGGSPDSCLALLLPYAQRVAAFMAILEGFSVLEISIGLDGIVQNAQTNEQQPIYSGQRVNARLDTLRHGMNAAERMLVFLEQNKDKECFKDWAASDERTDNLGHILPTAKVFTQYWANMANKRLTYIALRSRMIDVEENVVRPLLGNALYAELMGQLLTTVTEPNAQLLRFLRPMVAKLTAARGMPELMLHIEAYGVYHFLTEKNERSTEVLKDAKDSRIYEVKERLTLEAETHRSDLVDHLNTNVTLYPLFTQSAAYIDTTTTTDTTAAGTGRYRL